MHHASVMRRTGRTQRRPWLSVMHQTPPAKSSQPPFATLRLCCVYPCCGLARPPHTSTRICTDLDVDDQCRSRSPFLRQHFSCVRHGVPVPILPMSRELREELEPQEKASTRRLDTAVRAAQALRRAADIVVLTACPRCDTCVTVRRHAGGSNV